MSPSNLLYWPLFMGGTVGDQLLGKQRTAHADALSALSERVTEAEERAGEVQTRLNEELEAAQRRIEMQAQVTKGYRGSTQRYVEFL